MPHFDTQRPKVPSRPNRLRFVLNGGVLLYVLVVASTLGLLIGSFGELANSKQTALGETPNGNLAFETSNDIYAQVAEAIWVINANGSDLRRLTENVPPFSAGWSISPTARR
jgi:hypothetical protein